MEGALGKLDNRRLQVWQVSNLGFAHMVNDLMTTGLVPALLPLYKHAFHLNYTQTGLIVFMSYLTSSVMQPIFGYFTDRKPKLWLLPAGVFLSCLGLALSGIAPSLPWVLVFVAISGLGSGAFHPEASRGAHLAAGRGKGLAQAIFQVGGNAGQAFGPLMIPLFLMATGIRGVMWFLALGVFVFVVLWRLLPWYRMRMEQEQKRKRTIEGNNRIWAVILLVFVVILRSWCQIGVSGFLPFFYQQQHMSLNTAELFNFLFLGAGAVGTFIGGTMSDRIGKKWLLLGSMLLSAPFAFLLPKLHGTLAAIDLIAFGFLVLSSFAVTVVYCQMLLPKNIAMASGLMIGFGVGAGGIGATMLGWITDHFGVGAVFDFIVLLPLLGAIISAFLVNDQTLIKKQA
ncbi:MFS transporter [Fodinisporobacter ferrooxydans]